MINKQLRVVSRLFKLVRYIYNMGRVGFFLSLACNRICISIKDFFTFHIETETVSVKQGELRGRKLVSCYGKTYYRFQGVPYAKPPVGALRFKDPEPPEPWEGVRDALQEGSVCAHYDIITGRCKGSEDCLFLNIFTPQLPKLEEGLEPKAVLVWIHGGGFQIGSGNAEIYGPDFLLNDDVILVTLNYRLGALGFLSSGTEDAPGNAGLKDLVMALRWIQENIKEFGGDPKRVTIFGESAGGAAVQYLLLSPTARGLFHNAISQSGSSLSPWAFTEQQLECTTKLAKSFGCDSKDPKTMVEFLRKVSAKTLAKKQSVALTDEMKRSLLPFAFVPCAEPADYSNAFINKPPLEALQKGEFADVPYMTGINEMEGMILLKTIMDKQPPASEVDKDFERVMPADLKLKYGSPESKEVAQKVKKFYFQERPFDKNTHTEYVHLTTDTNFLRSAQLTTHVHTQLGKSPVYNYEFTFEGELGLFKKLLNIKNIPGPAHADDLGYLFYVPVLGPDVNPNLPEIKVSKMMCRLWTNFAKYGNPTPDNKDELLGLTWSQYSPDKPAYLEIGKQLEMKESWKSERLKFWKELVESLES